MSTGVSPTPPKSPDLKERGIYLLNSDIDGDASKGVVTWILESQFIRNPSFDHLTLIINSRGGYVTDSFAITDTMKGSPIPIHTVGLGEVASCGLLIFIAGAKGHRILTPDTSILSHQYSGGTWGKEHELLSSQKRFDLLSEQSVRFYKEHTGLKEKVIREKLLPPHDVWLTAKEAKELNLCDEIRLMGS